jgi:hypothetical protein
MTDTTASLLGMAIAAVVSLAVILFLRGRLLHILTELCGTPERGAFWTSLTNVLVVLTTIAAALLPSYDGPTWAEDALRGLKWALFGLIASLIVVAILIARFATLDARRQTTRPENS